MTRELINMTPEEGREAIREIMGAFNKYRALWLDHHGTIDGFESWFNRQIMNRKED